ncbi:MAG TPA: SDR family oxidoreductase [Candidatus Angelobacter sp.]|nr:SDR family oxidoreductase [Candidatus Angelobacter sp.]
MLSFRFAVYATGLTGDYYGRTMKGKVIVITGATSGIGQVAAERLAAMGARMVQVARDKERGQAAMTRLNQIAPGLAHTIYYADLSRLREMKRVAAEIAQAEPRIDVLINNAGAMFGTRQLTEDGLERTFALNHMSYFVMTQGLRDRLAASAPARVVNTASDAHTSGTVDFDDLQSEKAYRFNLKDWMRYGGPAFKVYARSKLMNILYTRELARKLAGTGVTTNSLHPGFVATRFGDQTGGLIGFGIGIAKRFALTPEQGAETLVYLASSPDMVTVTGEYFHKCRPATPSREAQDDLKAQRLWLETSKLAHMRN